MELLNRVKDKEIVQMWSHNFQIMLPPTLSSWEIFEKVDKGLKGYSKINSKLNYLFLLNEAIRTGNYSSETKEFITKYTEITWKNYKDYDDESKSSKFPHIHLSQYIVSKNEFLFELYEYLKKEQYIQCEFEEFLAHFDYMIKKPKKIHWKKDISILYCLISLLIQMDIITSKSWVSEVKLHFENPEKKLFHTNNMYSLKNKYIENTKLLPILIGLKSKYYISL